MRNVITLMLLLSTIALTHVSAQTFAPPFGGFSKVKPCYITMKDGSEEVVRIKKFFVKKGVIDELKVVDYNEGGKKVKINPEDIAHMYIAPSQLGKWAQQLHAATDLRRIQDNEISSEHLEEGYLYMESTKIKRKKKEFYGMLQVMNPTFSKEIKVYNDPISRETVGFAVGGIDVAGGLDKSYFIKKRGENVARWIKKKEYKQDMDVLFKDCPEVIKKYGDNPKWTEFEQFIYDYSIMCGEE